MNFIKSSKRILLLVLALGLSLNTFSQSLEHKIDELVSKQFPANETGISILVAKSGRPIYQKAFGLANLELNTPMTPNHVFEIGSITKQFTAVAILMLEAQGKLKVEDEITKYISDYPTQGNTITIHQLLNHTSGIKSYTSVQSFRKLSKTDLSPKALIDVFKNEPMDFNSGEKYKYNNSGYILLGHIIEVVSKQSYEDFIEKNIFDKLGMHSSFYGHKYEIIKNRAYGYKKSKNNFLNADYISMTLPYAAGSLMSTTGDLLKWQNALVNNTLISEESFEKASNGSLLKNGTAIDYGYGLHKKRINESTSIEHGGSIFGYKSMGIYLPEEKIFVSALSNCNCKSPSVLAKKIAAIAINKPFPKLEDSISLTPQQINKWVGAYEFNKSTIRHITVINNKIFIQKEGEKKRRLFPLSENKFFYKVGYPILEFSKKSDDTKTLKIIAEDKNHIGNEIDKLPPVEKKEFQVKPEILEKYVGEYQLQPGFIIEITKNGNKLFGQATNQPKFRLFAKSESKFFLKAVVASIDFNKKENGDIKSLTLHQNGQHITGEKIK